MNFVVALDHVQIAIPRHAEDRARAFYCELLGLVEIPKPAPLAARGGLWLEVGNLQMHLGVEEPFHPAGKAHPALRIRLYRDLLDKLREAGYEVRVDTMLDGIERSFVDDPFGNRVELINAAT
ncbi:MAG: VOC family protein [Rudaea sp.]